MVALIQAEVEVVMVEVEVEVSNPCLVWLLRPNNDRRRRPYTVGWLHQALG